MKDLTKGPALVLGPEEGASYWQPAPHRGCMTVKLGPHNLHHKPFSMGIQVMPPGCHVRTHGHAQNDEVFYILEGTGRCVIDGEMHLLEPGSTVMRGRYCGHSIHNDGAGDMKFHPAGPGAGGRRTENENRGQRRLSRQEKSSLTPFEG